MFCNTIASCLPQPDRRFACFLEGHKQSEFLHTSFLWFWWSDVRKSIWKSISGFTVSCVILIFGGLFRIRGRRISWSNSVWKPGFFLSTRSAFGADGVFYQGNITGNYWCLLSGCCASLGRGYLHTPCSQWCCQLFPTEALLAGLARFRFELAGKNFLLFPSLSTLLSLFFFFN